MMQANNKIAANWLKISSDLQSQLIASEEDKIKLLTENERLRGALEHWVFLYAWKAEGMNIEQAKIHAGAFMMTAALQPKEGEG